MSQPQCPEKSWSKNAQENLSLGGRHKRRNLILIPAWKTQIRILAGVALIGRQASIWCGKMCNISMGEMEARKKAELSSKDHLLGKGILV